MRLLKKTYAACDAERNIAARQLKLQLQRVKVRTIENRHPIQIHPFVPQLQHALRYEGRLAAEL